MHSKNYISLAQEKAIQMTINSTITHRHGCAAICVHGKNKGQIVACGFNYSSLRVRQSSDKRKKYFERTSCEKSATKRLFVPCRDGRFISDLT